MKVWLISIFLIIAIGLRSQSIYDSIPIHEYKFSSEIRTYLNTKNARIHSAAQDFSYIGNVQEVAKLPYNQRFEWGFDTLTQDDIEYYKQFQAVNAIEYLVNKSKEEQIIIVNEAHHKPRHRVFTRKLLKGLYENGYRYLGLEALSGSFRDSLQLLLDSLMMERGYPFNSWITGTYTKEPQMGNLVREAIEIGYSLFAYDRNRKGDREIIQAQNIEQKILRNDPEAKILIHCGWYHLLEKENRNKKWMAYHLERLTGIDPFTVYQDILVERPSTQESPFYGLIKEETSSIFIDKEGEPYNGKPNFELFDALVFHPRTRYIENRPDWLMDQNSRKYVVNHALIEIAYPILVKAYKMEDSQPATPLDIIELESKWSTSTLILKEGKYRLKLVNLDGDKQIMQIDVKDGI